jgi:hypothetical protein
VLGAFDEIEALRKSSSRCLVKKIEIQNFEYKLQQKHESIIESSSIKIAT